MSPVIEVVAPRLLGPALMVAAAIIVKGYTDVGDGFSAGVIVALAVALRYVALGRRARPSAVSPCSSTRRAIAVGRAARRARRRLLPGAARRPAVHALPARRAST